MVSGPGLIIERQLLWVRSEIYQQQAPKPTRQDHHLVGRNGQTPQRQRLVLLDFSSFWHIWQLLADGHHGRKLLLQDSDDVMEQRDVPASQNRLKQSSF